jgi:hypothetical protein
VLGAQGEGAHVKLGHRAAREGDSQGDPGQHEDKSPLEPIDCMRGTPCRGPASRSVKGALCILFIQVHRSVDRRSTTCVVDYWVQASDASCCLKTVSSA